MSPKPIQRGLTSKALAAYGISSVVAAATAFGAVQRIIYTRAEGCSLERRIDRVEHEYREDVRQVRRSLELIWTSVQKRREEEEE